MGLGVSQLGRLGRLGLGSDQLGDAGAEGPSFPPDAYFYADLLANTVRLNGVDYTGLANVAGYSFARASQAYALNSAGELLSFASGALRLTNKGLLIEGSAQNLVLQSADFSTTWTNSNSSETSAAGAAPDGTTTAYKLIPANLATDGRLSQNVASLSSGATYTFSCYGKAAELSNFRLYMDDSGSNAASVSYNLSTGTVSSAAAVTGTWTAVSTTVTALANGWYRCTLTFTATSAAPTRCQIWCRDTGNGTSGILIWGAQLETGSAATSYIPTTTGAVTRAADVLSIGVSGLSYPVTLFAEFERASDSGATSTLLHLDAGNNNDRLVLRINSSDQAQSDIQSGAAAQSQLNVAGALAVGTIYRAAVRCATNDSNLARGGSLAGQDATVTVPATPTTIRIGTDGSSVLPAFAYLRRLAIYPSAYTDAQLQVLTT